jgi:hypothetical protein
MRVDAFATGQFEFGLAPAGHARFSHYP